MLPSLYGGGHGGSADNVRGNWGARGPGAWPPVSPGGRSPGTGCPLSRYRTLPATRQRPRHRAGPRDTAEGPGRAGGSAGSPEPVLAGGTGPEGAGAERTRGRRERGTHGVKGLRLRARRRAGCGPAGRPSPPSGTGAAAARPRRSVLTRAAEGGQGALPARPGPAGSASGTAAPHRAPRVSRQTRLACPHRVSVRAARHVTGGGRKRLSPVPHV